ncbi:MAG: BatB protein [Haliea sp.]|nr:BatB protein [Haliea sp.]|tara:strand:- start:180491 stop:181510 length:1020 start_codon:yes stop_codon:yes gene_type:complete
MIWQWPWILLLLPLPWLVWQFTPPAHGKLPRLRAPFAGLWQRVTGSSGDAAGHPRRPLHTLLLSLLWLALLAAAARPAWIGDPVELPRSGRDLMLAMDISGSMRVEDMQVGDQRLRRIDAVKAVCADFMARRQGDRVGLILFGSNAYVQSPLTFDTRTVETFLRESQIGFAGQETAIGDAIGLAVKRLRDRPQDQRVLVLLTDGQDNASSVRPLEAARLAAQLGIRIYTIGVGAEELTLPGLFGSSLGSRTVNPSAELDEQTLVAIAEQTGGRYFRARDPAELSGIYQLLDQLEPIEQDRGVYRPRQSLMHWPLGLAMALALALFALSRRRPAASGGQW